MPQDHLCDFFECRLRQMFAGLKVMQDLPENTWITLCAARNHKSIASGLCLHRDHILRRQQVSVADHRYWNRFFYLPYDIPVRPAGVELLTRPPMHRNCCRTRILCNLGHLYCIDMLIVKAFSDFDRDRLVDCLYRLTDNFTCKLRILHKCWALTVVHDLRNRAAHIQIQDIERAILNLMRNVWNNFRIRAEKL